MCEYGVPDLRINSISSLLLLLLELILSIVTYM